jgi:4-hydroxythreonine-4-phosphate dehydrogenase
LFAGAGIAAFVAGIATYDGILRISRNQVVAADARVLTADEVALGREEIEVIAPAVERLRAKGHCIFDPVPADSLFHPAARRGYDAVLCMYHDQALIPLKTIDFDHGVNITLGLPVIRTSPDHGTAFDIAGRGKADPSSLLEALKTAQTMATARLSAKSAVQQP